MLNANNALHGIPDGLRAPLLDEYNLLLNNYVEQRWSPSELSGGKFCEVVYTIINGMATGIFPSSPSKPRNIVDACKSLENQTILPRGLRILVPRMLPALYEIRNNRGVGHVGGDVVPNCMDSSAVVSMCSWIMSELIRVHHNLSTEEAQKIVDLLSNRKIPIVWEGENIKRVLNPKMSLKDQILILIACCPQDPSIDDLITWTDSKNKTYFKKLTVKLHGERLIEFNKSSNTVTLLPPGSNYVSNLLADHKT